jgi:hypothetical protein
MVQKSENDDVLNGFVYLYLGITMSQTSSVPTAIITTLLKPKLLHPYVVLFVFSSSSSLIGKSYASIILIILFTITK